MMNLILIWWLLDSQPSKIIMSLYSDKSKLIPKGNGACKYWGAEIA